MDIKKLTKRSNSYGYDTEKIKFIKDVYNIEIPEYFISFIKEYGGTSTDEFIYSEKYWVNVFLPLSWNDDLSVCLGLQIYKQAYNDVEWLPFASDPGGWIYCIALRNDIKNQVWVNADDESELDFEYVSDSFEEFINGLKVEDE